MNFLLLFVVVKESQQKRLCIGVAFFLLAFFSFAFQASATVPTSYGWAGIQRTALDTGNVIDWCLSPITNYTSVSNAPDANGYLSFTYDPVNNVSYKSGLITTQSDRCNDTVSNKGLPTFMPNRTDGYRLYVITDGSDDFTNAEYVRWIESDGGDENYSPITETSETYSFGGVTYKIYDLGPNSGLATSSGNLGLLSDIKDSSYLSFKVYAVLYDNVNLMQIADATEMKDYMDALFGFIESGGEDATTTSPFDYQTRFTGSSVTGASSSTVEISATYYLDTSEFTSANRPDMVSVTTYNSSGNSWNTKKMILPLTDGTHTVDVEMDTTYPDGTYNYDIHFWNINSDYFTFIETSVVGRFTVSGGVVTTYTEDGVYTSQNPPAAPQVCSITNLGGCIANLVDYFFNRQTATSNDTSFLNSIYTLMQDAFLEKHPFAWPREALITIKDLADTEATSSTTPETLTVTFDLAPGLTSATSSGHKIQMYELAQAIGSQETNVTAQPISQACGFFEDAMDYAGEEAYTADPCGVFRALTTGIIWLSVVIFYGLLVYRYFLFAKGT